MMQINVGKQVHSMHWLLKGKKIFFEVEDRKMSLLWAYQKLFLAGKHVFGKQYKAMLSTYWHM